jgi:hypothetical protein
VRFAGSIVSAQMYKTNLCGSVDTGICTFGRNCSFGHANHCHISAAALLYAQGYIKKAVSSTPHGRKHDMQLRTALYLSYATKKGRDERPFVDRVRSLGDILQRSVLKLNDPRSTMEHFIMPDEEVR